MRIRPVISLGITLFLLLSVFHGVFAGSSWDIGTVPGLPPVGAVNWLAWLDKTIQPGGYPIEVLTEDSTNPGIGTNQGYQNFGAAPNPKWILKVTTFSNEVQGDTVSILLGGLGTFSSNGWSDSFTWVTTSSTTSQGDAVAVPSFNACPIMLSGVQNGSGKTINWQGVNSEYLIYRSQNASGAGNGASNGRYSYVSSVPQGTFSYLDSVCVTGVDCWHIVVPANGSGVINGCHSEESDPTAVTLTSLSANSSSAPIKMGLFVVVPLAVAIPVVLIARRRRASEQN